MLAPQSPKQIRNTRPVPPEFKGLWRRRLLVDEKGRRDTSTAVWWLQSETLFVDLRVPSNRPDFSECSGFHDLSIDQALFMASQEGFAGRLHHLKDALGWRRHIDFRPLEGPPDEGAMKRVRRNTWIETGLHADYLEEWEQVLTEKDLTNSVTQTEERENALLVQVGSYFMRAQDRRSRPPPFDLTAATLSAYPAPKALQHLLDCEISFGRVISNQVGQISNSTHPWLEKTKISLALQGP